MIAQNVAAGLTEENVRTRLRRHLGVSRLVVLEPLDLLGRFLALDVGLARLGDLLGVLEGPDRLAVGGIGDHARGEHDEGLGPALGKHPCHELADGLVGNAEHLGGRFEAVGDDFEGSSIQVPEDSANLPGLAEALASKVEG